MFYLADRASDEGWGIFDAIGSVQNRNGDRPLQLQAIDESEMIPDDDAAWTFVAEHARDGVAHCVIAMHTLKLDSPGEYRAIVDYVGFDPLALLNDDPRHPGTQGDLMNAMTPISTSGLLSTRAMVVSLTVNQWSGRRLDREVTAEVNADHGADADAGRYNKLLLPKGALEPIMKIVNATRTEFLKRTLPWLNDGSRIMRAEGFLDHSQWFRTQKDVFETEVDSFIQKYPGYLSAASGRLGSMFRHEDYPDVHVLRGKFDMQMTILPAPSADDFRVSIADSQADLIRAQIEATVTEGAKTAVADVYSRVRRVTEAMVERLTAFKPGEKGRRAEGTFRDSLVENVKELIGLMPVLNITGDPELDRLAEEMKAITVYDADVLRASDTARAATKDKAAAILAGLEGILA